MKYIIYKINNNLNGLRWWQNYDNNHRDVPDITIESYLSNKSRSWVQMKNTRNEDLKYQSITKDNLNEIEIYIDDIKNVPDYLKIVYTKSDNTTESAYYYIKNTPSIYNSQTKLACSVVYVLDEWASFGYRCHDACKTNNLNMFFVRKHANRVLDRSGWKYFDCNTQPYLKINKEETSPLMITGTKTLNSINDIDIQLLNGSLKDTISEDWRYTSTKMLEHKDSTTGNWETNLHLGLINGWNTTCEQSASVLPIRTSMFTKNNNVSKTWDGGCQYYEYIVTKVKGWKTGTASATELVEPEKFMFWPLPKEIMTSNLYWATGNTYDRLYKLLPDIFTADNVICRFMSPLSPIAIAAMSGSVIKVNGDPYNGCCTVRYQSDTSDTTLGCILTNGLPDGVRINTYFDSRIKTLLDNFNTNANYKKWQVNNPHLLAPQNWNLTYQSSSNNKIEFTSDYIDLSSNNNFKLYMGWFSANTFYTRLGTTQSNTHKIYSQSMNELCLSDCFQAPIDCTAWNNTYLQRQAIDNGRNAQVASKAAGITASTLALIAGIALSATGVGSAIGVPTVIGGIGGIAGSSISLSKGLAQSENQKKQLDQQSGTLNLPESVSGLGYLSGINEEGFKLHTMGLNSQDASIMNIDDNMYGYYVKNWAGYNTYDNCWHGNYILCDMSKNYSNVFKTLKNSLSNSIFGQNDNYINSFINMLNNGVTFHANGEYHDLASDDDNWEKIFPAPTA